MKPTGPSKLEAAGIKVGPGSKVVALLSGAGSSTVTVRFTVE